MKNRIPDDEYAKIVQDSGGRCAICTLPNNRLYLDHDHATSLARGMLCTSCNTGLGMFKDDPARLARAISYLQRAPIPTSRKIRIPRQKVVVDRNIEVPLQAPILVSTSAEIGAVVLTLRKKHIKMRQAQMAAFCNVGTRFLSDLENGKTTLWVGPMLKVLRAMGLELMIKNRDPFRKT